MHLRSPIKSVGAMTEKASHRFAIYDNLYNALGLLLVYPLSWSKLTQLSKDVWVENANWVENPTSRCLAGIWCQTKKNSRQGNSHMSMSILFTLHAVFYFSSFRSFTKGLPLISPCAESYSILRSDGCDRLQPIWYPSLFGAPAYLVPQPIWCPSLSTFDTQPVLLNIMVRSPSQ